MTRFVIARVWQAVLAIWMLSLAVFVSTRATGDPLQVLLPPYATKEDAARLAAELGLDRSIGMQYLIYMRDLLTGNFGHSHRSGELVTTLFGQRLPASLELAGLALLIILVCGISFGVISALKRDSFIDRAVKVAALLGQAVPPFGLGILLILIFAVWLRWLPAGTRDGFSSAILPAISLAGFGVAGVARLVRSSMLDVLDSEFVKLVRAKGMSERIVIYRHALRNALLPVLNFSGVLVVGLITTALTVETVFGWPGIGQLIYTAILNRDFPVVQGLVLLTCSIAIAANLAVDIISAKLDPRIRIKGR